MLDLKKSIRFLKGVGPKKAELYKTLGLETMEDLIYYFPRSYEDQSGYTLLINAVNDVKNSFVVKVKEKLPTRYLRNKMTMDTFIVEDSSYQGKLVFFNNKYIGNSLKTGQEYFVYGKAKWYNNNLSIASPTFELWDKKSRDSFVVPTYNLKKGVRNSDLIKLVDNIIKSGFEIEENIPMELVNKYKLMDKKEAILKIHRPQNMEELKQVRRRLVFEELLLFQLALFSIKNVNKSSPAVSFKPQKKLEEFINKLPYKLTTGQSKALNEILIDMGKPVRMNRLLQGDVGSGKTIVSVIAMYLAVLNGYQATIMVPTEVLAKQHLRAIRELLDSENIHVELLVGSSTAKNKSIILERLKNGEIDILIGTHALLEENVQFRKLGLTVTDEQHRFGVNQRKNFSDKELSSHILVMTATPIPRTLALILYGDLDISIIDTMPSGRKEIKTSAINGDILERALHFIKSQIDRGRQAYIICPLIEDNEIMDLNSVEAIYENLKESYFTNNSIEFLHGRMTSEEKTDIMSKFERGETAILVSTTVIEVGINVPNASVILIYNAERFGLAQLHQLRGRVGRGEHQSYCILYNESKSKLSWQRMKVIENSNDGFYIAEKDLVLRGEGDILGTRQHGLPELKIAQLERDINVLKYAQMEASKILKEDPKLINSENKLLKSGINSMFNPN